MVKGVAETWVGNKVIPAVTSVFFFVLTLVTKSSARASCLLALGFLPIAALAVAQGDKGALTIHSNIECRRLPVFCITT